MTQNQLQNIYFDWLYDMMCGNRYADEISFRKLFVQLHSTEFTYTIDMDENRARDGINLRYKFALHNGYMDIYEEYLDGPCSVLEMIVALAIRCEEHIMDDPTKGDRTGQWFWRMIVSLGLGGMYDSNYDKQDVMYTINRFLNRDYEPDGRGGLFTIRNCNEDLRKLEIIYQLYRYINSIA